MSPLSQFQWNSADLKERFAGRGALATDSKHLAKEIKFEGPVFWLDSVAHWAGDDLVTRRFHHRVVPPTFKDSWSGGQGERAELSLMKEFCIGKSLTFEMFNVISRTGSFRRRSLH